MQEFTVARLEEIDEVRDGRCPFRPVRHHMGIMGFGATAWTGKAVGDRIINEHHEDHPGAGEELYVVMSGHAEFEIDGQKVDAPAGTFVNVAPSLTRTAFAREAGTTILAVGGAAPGQPYRPSGWELFTPLLPLFEQGAYEEGAERARKLLAGDPPYSALYYNTACFEAGAGRDGDALAHLRRAFELEPSLAEFASGDDDLASLRDRPEFARLVDPQPGS
jgi:tetratricopeptide (TPR) repeat protein